MRAGNTSDFLVVGAGMAGASAAACLAEHGRVVLLEREQQPGYHSTGRSAAVFSEIYGNAEIRALTRASRDFLFAPPIDFSPTPLVSPRQALYFARPDQVEQLLRFRTDPDVRAATAPLTATEVLDRIPIFRPGYVAAGVIESGSADLDVHAIHQGFLRQIRQRKSIVHVDSEVSELSRRGGVWHAVTTTGTYSAPVLVNAAGAWGDAIARLAGLTAVGLQPKRRTAVLIPAPPGQSTGTWPAAVDISEQFYFKPDAGLLLLSPADEEPSDPCDAQPEELDIATAVDRFESATVHRVQRVQRSWAGLRVFAPDRTPVVGFDPDAEGFFWLVGQGGYGIQTAPALGQIASSLITGHPVPSACLRSGVQVEMLSKQRFHPASGIGKATHPASPH